VQKQSPSQWPGERELRRTERPGEREHLPLARTGEACHRQRRRRIDNIGINDAGQVGGENIATRTGND
jgi:hypothetical protein